MALNDDIKAAQKILGNSYQNINKKEAYHAHSFIYKTTNENIYAYQKYLNNKESIMTVTASGDQALNSILGGSKELDCFDISVFPKYYLELKIAAVKTLTREEYINYFFNDESYYDDLSENIYEKIRKNLDKKTLVFFDSLYNFFDGYEIYNSNLFSSEPFSIQSQIERNPYLNRYNELKNKINDIHINYHEGNIYKIINNQKSKYDIINLSSIIYYGKNTFFDYKEFLENISILKDKGIALTYLYQIKEIIKELNEIFDNCTIDKFENEGVLIYTKSL